MPGGIGIQGPRPVLSVVVSVGVFIAVFHVVLPRLLVRGDPERALDLMVSRTMEAQDGLLLAPDWQKRVTEWTAGGNDAERLQAITWYQELVRETDSPSAKLRLAILQAESGRKPEALAMAKTWLRLGIAIEKMP